MTSAMANETTRLLTEFAKGDRSALERLIPLVYADLHALAARSLAGERRGHTLQPTALVNEAVIRLADLNAIDWQSRAHFLAMAATTVRRVLVDYARARSAQKRGGGRSPLTIMECADRAVTEEPTDLLALNEALCELASVDARHAQVVELKFFGGATSEQAAEVLGVSVRTIKDDWRVARAWLRSRLAP